MLFPNFPVYYSSHDCWFICSTVPTNILFFYSVFTIFHDPLSFSCAGSVCIYLCVGTSDASVGVAKIHVCREGGGVRLCGVMSGLDTITRPVAHPLLASCSASAWILLLGSPVLTHTSSSYLLIFLWTACYISLAYGYELAAGCRECVLA
jgi:hypothetical protein